MISARAVLVPVAAAALGIAVGAAWQRGKSEGVSEDVVAREAALVAKQSGVPGCADVMRSADGYGETHAAGASVHWRYDRRSGKLQRVVVSRDLDVGHDEGVLACEGGERP